MYKKQFTYFISLICASRGILTNACTEKELTNPKNYRKGALCFRFFSASCFVQAVNICNLFSPLLKFTNQRILIASYCTSFVSLLLLIALTLFRLNSLYQAQPSETTYFCIYMPVFITIVYFVSYITWIENKACLFAFKAIICYSNILIFLISLMFILGFKLGYVNNGKFSEDFKEIFKVNPKELILTIAHIALSIFLPILRLCISSNLPIYILLSIIFIMQFTIQGISLWQQCTLNYITLTNRHITWIRVWRDPLSNE